MGLHAPRRVAVRPVVFLLFSMRYAERCGGQVAAGSSRLSRFVGGNTSRDANPRHRFQVQGAPSCTLFSIHYYCLCSCWSLLGLLLKWDACSRLFLLPKE